MMEPAELLETRAAMYHRMGVRGWRSELGWNEEADGKCDWDRYDRLFAAAEKTGCKIMVTLGGHSGWRWTFGEPTPAAGWTAGCFGYGGTGDWVCKPELYERYGRWITAFCQRYWKDGRGALWGLENYNEPWEGGGISGWARDMLQYRALQKLIATSARKVSPQIKILAASSIMNTEDKLFSDGSREFDQYIDIFTDHYVVPPSCYGPLVARAHGKESMETETWFVNAEYLLPQGVAQFMACGQQRLAPWHPRVLFDPLPGNNDNYLIPSPVVAATAALNHFLTGKQFEKIVFRDHLPWVFQFGKDNQTDALLMVFGQLMPIAGNDPKDRLWSQVDAAPGGKMTIDNADGLLQFYDLAGNPIHQGDRSVELPMTIFPTYITCRQGAVAAGKRLAAARIEGKRAVEILPRDFTERVADGATLSIDLHNCLNRTVSGELAVQAPRRPAAQADFAPREARARPAAECQLPVDPGTGQRGQCLSVRLPLQQRRRQRGVQRGAQRRDHPQKNDPRRRQPGRLERRARRDRAGEVPEARINRAVAPTLAAAQGRRAAGQFRPVQVGLGRKLPVRGRAGKRPHAAGKGPRPDGRAQRRPLFPLRRSPTSNRPTRSSWRNVPGEVSPRYRTCGATIPKAPTTPRCPRFPSAATGCRSLWT